MSMDSLTNHALRYAESMRIFADGDKNIVFGQWREWKSACEKAGKLLPPEDFKSKTKNG